MHTVIRSSMSLVCALSLGAAVLPACGEESASQQQQPLTAALERPFEACQERFETCRVTPGADPAACQASMRGCLEEVATWMQKSRALIEMCRAEAAQCRVSQPLQSRVCDEQLEACVAPAFQPGASDEDAGVPSDQDAGASTPTGAAGAAGDPGAAGRGPGRGRRPGLPPRVPMIPTLPTPADACRSELLECLSPSADFAACATRAQACLRASLIPTL